MGSSGGSVVKNPPASGRDAGNVGLISGSGRSPGGGNGNPLQYSCLGNPMDRGAWQLESRRSQSRAWLTNWACMHALQSLPPGSSAEITHHISHGEWSSPGDNIVLSRMLSTKPRTLDKRPWPRTCDSAPLWWRLGQRCEGADQCSPLSEQVTYFGSNSLPGTQLQNLRVTWIWACMSLPQPLLWKPEGNTQALNI